MKAMSALLPLLSFLLIQVVVAGGNGRASLPGGAIASPEEVKAYWEKTLPNIPMPQAILDTLSQQQEDDKSKVSTENIHTIQHQKVQTSWEFPRKMGQRKKENIFSSSKGSQVNGDDSKIDKFIYYSHGPQVEADDSKMGKFIYYNKDPQFDGDDSKMGKFIYYKHGPQVDGDDSKMGKFIYYKHGPQVDGDDSKMGKFIYYNNDPHVDGDDSKMGKFIYYNKDPQFDGDDSKMGKFIYYSHGPQVEADDSKIGKFIYYNNGPQFDGDDSKMSKFIYYSPSPHVDGDDSNMGKFIYYNKDPQFDSDDSKMGKFIYYSHGPQVEADDSKMGKFIYYNNDPHIHGDDSKMSKFIYYSPGPHVDGDDSKMGKFIYYNKNPQFDGDDSKMGKFIYYKHGPQVEVDESKMGKFIYYNNDPHIHGDDSKMSKFIYYKHGPQVDGDDSKMGKFIYYRDGPQVDGDDSKMGKFIYYRDGPQVDGDDSKMEAVSFTSGAHNRADGLEKEGKARKQIHSHGHSHVRLPQGAEDFFFFEDSLTTGTTRSTVIASTILNPSFLHRDASKHIPFSARNLTDILGMFAPVSLTMANDIAFALQLCEDPKPINGDETVGCATSIEDYLEFIISTLGTNQLRAFSADVPKQGIKSQRYTVASATLLTNSESVLACHDVTYPYKVFYCHTSAPTRAYQVKLVSDAGGSLVDALAVCHLNTSSWDSSHVFFQTMHVKPGQTTACHYLNRGSIIWVPTSQLGAATQ